MSFACFMLEKLILLALESLMRLPLPLPYMSVLVSVLAVVLLLLLFRLAGGGLGEGGGVLTIPSASSTLPQTPLNFLRSLSTSAWSTLSWKSRADANILSPLTPVKRNSKRLGRGALRPLRCRRRAPPEGNMKEGSSAAGRAKAGVNIFGPLGMLSRVLATQSWSQRPKGPLTIFPILTSFPPPTAFALIL